MDISNCTEKWHMLAWMAKFHLFKVYFPLSEKTLNVKAFGAVSSLRVLEEGFTATLTTLKQVGA